MVERRPFVSPEDLAATELASVLVGSCDTLATLKISRAVRISPSSTKSKNTFVSGSLLRAWLNLILSRKAPLRILWRYEPM